MPRPDPMMFRQEWKGYVYVCFLALDNWPDESVITDELLQRHTSSFKRDGDRLTIKVENGLAIYRVGPRNDLNEHKLFLISASIDRAAPAKK